MAWYNTGYMNPSPLEYTTDEEVTAETPRVRLLGRFMEFLQPKVEAMKQGASTITGQISELATDPQIAELRKEQQKIHTRDLALTFLTLAEVVPGLETANEASKSATIFDRIARVVREGKNGGKLSKYLPDMYPDMPSWFLTACALPDAAGIPLVGVLPELTNTQ